MLVEFQQDRVVQPQNKPFAVCVRVIKMNKMHRVIVELLLNFYFLKLDQQSCGATASQNNTYFVNPNYPNLWSGVNQT